MSHTRRDICPLYNTVMKNMYIYIYIYGCVCVNANVSVCRYNAIQHSKILHTSLRWLGLNTNKILDHRRHPIASPITGELWGVIREDIRKHSRVMKAPRHHVMYEKTSKLGENDVNSVIPSRNGWKRTWSKCIWMVWNKIVYKTKLSISIFCSLY